MTCKDCIHCEACERMISDTSKMFKVLLSEILKMNCDIKYDSTNILSGAEIGQCFQDRSRFVELPQSGHLCDAVHFVLEGLDEIDLQEYTFTVGKNAVSDTVQFITEIGTYGFWVGESPREFAPDYDDFYHWYELGKTVFLTREEAEQALKERELTGEQLK